MYLYSLEDIEAYEESQGLFDQDDDFEEGTIGKEMSRRRKQREGRLF